MSAPATVAFFNSKEDTATGHVARLDIAPADQGPKGDTGAPGPKGDTGAKGPAGARGPAGPQGETGPQGAVGPQGPQGPRGHIGPIGASGVQVFRGGISSVPVDSAFAFAGPTARFNIGAGQRAVATASAALAFNAQTTTEALVEVDICYRLAGSTNVVNSGFAYLRLSLGSTLRVVNVNQVFTGLSGNDITIGFCIRNSSGRAVDANDWMQGLVMVTN